MRKSINRVIKQKMAIARFMTSIILFFSSLLYGEILFAKIVVIKETGELACVLKNAAPGSLVIFDVDEVLVYPENVVQLQIAAPFWEATMADLEKRRGKATRDLLHSIMLLQSKWQLTDAEMPSLIQDLQRQKIRVIALTTFWTGKMGKLKSVEDWRSTHLKKHHIDFSITADISKSYFNITAFDKVSAKAYPVYKDGIIYTNHYANKGEVLGAFLKQANLSPTNIIFIDDKLKNVADIENFCNTANISYTGIHDNRILKTHNIFNATLGKYQFDYLENHYVWLSDLEAKKRLNMR
ncbi:MAG TPA: DUF2608 domain-containing protein [Gammaproteobacteria bacterium]|nr:DUF2608 domain-containing protein [Gammaproteobacteria bacterium]